jgi:phenylalanyl-tRNA synthetase alpha chain
MNSKCSGRINGWNYLVVESSHNASSATQVVPLLIVTHPGVDDKVGWAFGIGLDRLAMLLFDIPDIRLFWSEDERFLSQFSPGTVSSFKPFSKFPECYKDVSFWLNDPSTGFHENDLMEIFREAGGDIIEDVRLVISSASGLKSG